MLFLNVEPQSCYLEDLDTLKTCDQNYLFPRDYDTCVVFLFWKATESRNFQDQDLQDIVQEYKIHCGER